MKTMLTTLTCAFALILPIHAQTQISSGNNSPNIAVVSGKITIKPSPASEALTQAAADLTVEQRLFDTASQQAQNSLHTSQNQISAQLRAATTKLHDELAGDKKYRKELSAIDDLQKQLQNLATDAQEKFVRQISPIQNKIASDKALVDGLVPVVRQENELPITATFDPTKSPDQAWSQPVTK